MVLPCLSPRTTPTDPCAMLRRARWRSQTSPRQSAARTRVGAHLCDRRSQSTRDRSCLQSADARAKSQTHRRPPLDHCETPRNPKHRAASCDAAWPARARAPSRAPVQRVCERGLAAASISMLTCVGCRCRDDRDHVAVIEQLACVDAEERHLRRPDHVVGVQHVHVRRSIRVVVAGRGEQAGVERGAAGQIFFLGLGAVDEAAARVLGRGEVEQHEVGLTFIDDQAVRGGLRALVGDGDHRPRGRGLRGGCGREPRLELLGCQQLRAGDRGRDSWADSDPSAGLCFVPTLLDDREGVLGDALETHGA